MSSYTEEERETLCGFGPWRPKFMQILASKKVYMFFYGAIGIIKGMQYSYLSSMLTTIEKVFGIKSKETAYLMSGNEIAQILFLFFLPLTLKVKKRPLWCGIGMFITALGLYIMALPHFVSSRNFVSTESVKGSMTDVNQGLCGSEVHVNSLEGACAEDGSRVVNWFGLVVMFLGIALTGVGNSLFWCFGMVYLDDNSGKGNSPFMLSLTFVFRLIGPTFGYMLGASCLSTYVSPSNKPDDVVEGDPRWIGAWWIGFPIIATLLILFSIPLMFFPQRLPKADTDADKEVKKNLLAENKSEQRNDFVPAMKRLLKNKLYVTNYFSTVFYMFAFMGFGTFIPKYIEYQFRINASTSSRMSGSVGTAAKGIGMIFSGWLIGKFKFSARTLSAWNVFLGFCYFGTLLMFSFIGCPTSQMYGQMTSDGSYNISMSCNTECSCPVSRMQPICSKDGVTNFYSPCHAGCHDIEEPSSWLPDSANNTSSTKSSGRRNKVYTDCKCVESASRQFNTTLSNKWITKDVLSEFNHPPPHKIISEAKDIQMRSGDPITEAVSGWCEVPGCKTNFYYWIAAMGVLSILGSTSRVGNVLVALRCVEVRDKSLSFGIQVVSLSLLAMLPSPIFFGVIIDNTCLLWQEECGETTNCLLYDTDRLRRALMLTTAGIMLIGVLFDMAVVYYAKDLKLYDEDNKKEEVQITVNGETVEVSEDPKLKSRAYNLIYGSHASLSKEATFND